TPGDLRKQLVVAEARRDRSLRLDRCGKGRRVACLYGGVGVMRLAHGRSARGCSRWVPSRHETVPAAQGQRKSRPLGAGCCTCVAIVSADFFPGLLPLPEKCQPNSSPLPTRV